MGKLIAAINMTLDGYCDHTAVVADEELHQHYTDLLRGADTLLYGRITYQLMEYWRPIAETPSGDPSADEFAQVMDRVPKVVFSRTLEHVDWHSARLAHGSLQDEVAAWKQSHHGSGDLFVGSPSLIVGLTELGLVEEYQLCVHPVIAGSGLPLFKPIAERIALRLLRTKTLKSGAILLYYEPAKV